MRPRHIRSGTGLDGAGTSKGTRNGTSISSETSRPRNYGMALCDATRLWMTLTARAQGRGDEPREHALLGPLVPVTLTAGGSSCDTRQILNPLFGGALIGLPTGWTGFGSVATEWSR